MKNGHLTIQGLTKRYGNQAILKGIDLDVAPGEFVTLLGPSGSGKTTSLMLIAGFLDSDGGRIEIDGQDVTNLPAHRRNVGVVFQHYALFPHMSIRENIGYPLRMRGVRKSEIQKSVSEALAAVQLSAFGERLPGQLSGGQQQRIAVARATVYKPPLLLMDEPLSALDKSLRRDLQAEIRRLHRELATSVIYVTHDQEEALGMSDRIAVMNDGRIVQVDRPQAIYARPESRFVASFVGQSNFIDGELVGLDGAGVGVCRASNGALLRGKASASVRKGDAVSLMIRPENLHLAKPGDNLSNAVKVKLDDVIYQGRWSRCVGAFETGEPCLLELNSPETSGLAGPFQVRWSEQDAVIVAAHE